MRPNSLNAVRACTEPTRVAASTTPGFPTLHGRRSVWRTTSAASPSRSKCAQTHSLGKSSAEPFSEPRRRRTGSRRLRQLGSSMPRSSRSSSTSIKRSCMRPLTRPSASGCKTRRTRTTRPSRESSGSSSRTRARRPGTSRRSSARFGSSRSTRPRAKRRTTSRPRRRKTRMTEAVGTTSRCGAFRFFLSLLAARSPL